MKRIPLKKGEKVTSNYTYIIDDVLGSGATCIVYDAHFVDSHGNKKEVKLKECYPYDLSVKRAGNTLVWSKDEEKDTAIAKFEESYNLLSKMQNEEEIKDAAVYTLDLFDCNETKYIATIPSVGTSYDKCKNDDIVDIVTTCLALTNAVGKLHGLGYLHMDIKPENFIAVSDHTNKGKNVVFFDMDTFISFDEINNNTLKGVSYSEDWAAPEVKSRRFNKLCPATDIFSIGVVLFERILKRMPYCLDSMSYAEWTFDERFAPGKVSPEAQRLLSEIFHKTLASSIKKRYQSTDELSKALYELLKVINKKNYIISSFPTNTCTFVGRETEIAELHKGIKDTGRVFVSGFGGIGKSEIVKKYINIYGKDYDSVSFVRYTGSLIDDLKAIRIKGDVDPQDRMEVLAGLCNERTLIILDNFDVKTDDEHGLNALLELNCSLIITTRSDFSRVYPNSYFIKIHGLSDAELFRIYENESSNKLSENDKNVLTPLLTLGKECTFFWSIFSRLVRDGGYAVKKITQTVLSGIKNLNNTEEVLVTKDNLVVDRNISVAMKELLMSYKFDDEQIELLCFVRTFSVLFLTRNKLAKSFDQIDDNKKPSRMNALNKLIKLGLINEDDSIHMHDVLKDVIDAEFDISYFKLDLIDKFIDLEFKRKIKAEVNRKKFSSNYRAQAKCSYLCERIISVFENFDDTYSYEYLTTLIFDIVKTNEKTISVLHSTNLGRIIDILNNVINHTEINETVKIKALLILIIAYSEASSPHSYLKVTREHFVAMKRCEDTLNRFLLLINNNSVDKELSDFFYSIKINEFGTISEIIEKNPIDNYKFDFSSYYGEVLSYTPKPTSKLKYNEETARIHEKRITDSLLSITEGNNGKENYRIIYDFDSYVRIYKDLPNIKILAKQIYEKLFKNAVRTLYYKQDYSNFLKILVYYNSTVADGNPEKIMEELFNESARDSLIYSNFLISDYREGFFNDEFWTSIEYLIESSHEELAFKYEVLYTEKVEETVITYSLDKIFLHSYYKRLSEDSERLAKKEDLPLEEKEKYKKLSLEYQKKADDALGKKY